MPLILAASVQGQDRYRLLAEDDDALARLQRNLKYSGLWRDTLDANGRFADGPATAS
jgi:hypothetical protein